MYNFGITGDISSGKSHLSLLLKSHLPFVNIIEIDDIRRYILWHSVEPTHISIRKELSTLFSEKTHSHFYWMNRETFTQKLFSSSYFLSLFSKKMTPIIKEYIKHHYFKKNTVNVIVWVFLLEENYNELLNGEIILTQFNSQKNINVIHRQLVQKELFQRDLKRITFIFENNLDLLIDRIKKHVQ